MFCGSKRRPTGWRQDLSISPSLSLMKRFYERNELLWNNYRVSYLLPPKLQIPTSNSKALCE